jgi:hypothetical protein
MSGPFSDLPKFPGEQPADDPPARPEPPDTAADRLRHVFPAVIMVTAAGVGLVLVGGLAAVVVAARAVEGGWLGPVLLFVVFLTLPTVAIGAAVYQRAKARRDRGG